jgi:hypothetical protein
MVNIVVGWLDDPRIIQQLHAGRDFLIDKLRELIRGGVVDCDRVIDSADGGDLLAHQALMAEFDAVMQSHELPTVALIEYARSHRGEDEVRRPRGSHTKWDSFNRDIFIIGLAFLISDRFGIPLTRSEASDEPCAAGVLAKALKRQRRQMGVRLEKKSLANIIIRQKRRLEDLLGAGLNFKYISRA